MRVAWVSRGAQVRPLQGREAQMRMGKGGGHQARMAKARAGKVSPVEPGASQFAIAEMYAGKILPPKVCAVQVAPLDQEWAQGCAARNACSRHQSVHP
jgi:hypothetical protein